MLSNDREYSQMAMCYEPMYDRRAGRGGAPAPSQARDTEQLTRTSEQLTRTSEQLT
ncbi:MAG: hypothetical protein JWP44_4410, partial [Mucilaginibacter sp.]|nr:hypothetical protein [Mucilaginibacter sp.]